MQLLDISLYFISLHACFDSLGVVVMDGFYVLLQMKAMTVEQNLPPRMTQPAALPPPLPLSNVQNDSKQECGVAIYKKDEWLFVESQTAFN